MIFGDRSAFALEIAPLEPSWERRGLVDRGPWARLSVVVRNRYLTSLIEPSTRTVREYVSVPLIPIADWFVRNARAILFEESASVFRCDVDLPESLERWDEADPRESVSEEQWEDDRFAWYERHFWLSGADGALLPNLAFVRADGMLWVSWAAKPVAGARSVTFTELRGCDGVPADLGWQALSEFVGFVAADCRARGISDLEWLRDPDPLNEAARCSAAQVLELIAPGTADVLRQAGVALEIQPERLASLQAMRDLQLNPFDESLAKLLAELDQAVSSTGSSPSLHEQRMQLVQSSRGEATPEARGYEAARWLRSTRGLNGAVFETRDLEDLLGTYADLSTPRATSSRLNSLVGAREGYRGAAVLLDHERTRVRWVRRMEVARVLGHLLLDPTSPAGILGAASSDVARGPRRRRSGAFAAELLCPEDGVRHIVSKRDASNPDVFCEVMNTYGVGALTAAYQMWNHGMLRDSEERDALVSQFGSQDR